MVNFTVLRNVVPTSSKIIRHFENPQLIFTWHKMASMCAKFHCHTISSLENTMEGHFCPKIEYSTPDNWLPALTIIDLGLNGKAIRAFCLNNSFTDVSELLPTCTI